MKIRSLFGIETERTCEKKEKTNVTVPQGIVTDTAGRQTHSSCCTPCQGDEWADASVEVPVGDEEMLLVIASGDAGGVRYRHAVLFASYYPERGFEVDADGGERLTVEYWRPIPTLPEQIREEIRKEFGDEGI